MGAHGRKRPISTKAAGAAAAVAVAGLAVGLLGSVGDEDEPAAVREPVLASVPSPTSATPRQSPTQPQISSKPVSAAPRPTTASATPTTLSPSPSRSTPTAAPTTPASSAPAPPPPPAAPTVPHVVGMSVEEAAATLAAAGYGHQVVCQEGPSTGRVATQLPAGGQQWTPGGEVALFVSSRRCRDRPDRPWDDD